jgi:hypothetical protein
MSRIRTLGFSALSIGLLSGCATALPPAVSVLSIVGKTCGAAPSRAEPISLTPKRKAATYTVTTVVGPATSCVNMDGKASNYVIYALPASPQNHTLTVGGQKESLRSFAPSVSILDANGGVLRSFPKDRLTNFGTTFSVQFRPTPEARFVVVQSDPNMVGTVMSAFETNIVSSTVGTYTPAGGYSSSQQLRGQEGGTSRSFSHEGNVIVYIQAVTGKIGLPDDK